MPNPGPLTVSTLAVKTLSRPHPGYTWWSDSPSCTLWLPVLSLIFQSLPLTFTQDVAEEEFIPVPSKWLPETIPPIVPSLMSMLSAVVCVMLLSVMMLPSLPSGLQPL